MFSKAAAILGLAFLACLAESADAGLVKYSSRAAWTAAVNSSINVEHFTNRSGSFNNGQTVYLNDFSMKGFGDYNNCGYGPANFLAANALHGGVDATPITGFVVQYYTPVFAFGFDHSGAAGGGTLEIVIRGMNFRVVSDTGFLGVVATAGETFTSIRFQSSGFSDFWGQAESFVADDFSSATAAVPEPSTLASLAVGGIALALARLRRNRSARAV
jgi:hypothetical protein